ncbi:hypothetical protein [Streptomyces sp. C10]|uniref:hypothetical protein n=1 Tax=Streptomyces sp. C10 TaxID=531941 RepID=UPI00397ED9CE
MLRHSNGLLMGSRAARLVAVTHQDLLHVPAMGDTCTLGIPFHHDAQTSAVIAPEAFRDQAEHPPGLRRGDRGPGPLGVGQQYDRITVDEPLRTPEARSPFVGGLRIHPQAEQYLKSHFLGTQMETIDENGVGHPSADVVEYLPGTGTAGTAQYEQTAFAPRLIEPSFELRKGSWR